MRADRLLSILMLLQTRGVMTARALSDELGVSERTIYRDMIALNSAGIPVYTIRGPGGGCGLVDSYRTSLTGLSRAEARSLFLLSIPEPLVDLGLDEELKSALRKLAAALPESRRGEWIDVAQRVYLDWRDWSQMGDGASHLTIISQAVWRERQLHLTLRFSFETVIERRVSPLGLVAKAGAWYLVSSYPSGIRVYPVSCVQAARLTEDAFERPPDFDLVDFWKGWRDTYRRNRASFIVVARIALDLLPYLPGLFGERFHDTLAGAPKVDERGWITLRLPFENFEQARGKILSFGRSIEILEPIALRYSVLDFALQIVDLYQEG